MDEEQGVDAPDQGGREGIQTSDDVIAADNSLRVQSEALQGVALDAEGYL